MYCTFTSAIDGSKRMIRADQIAEMIPNSAVTVPAGQTPFATTGTGVALVGRSDFVTVVDTPEAILAAIEEACGDHD
jgi:hypothetical protein